MKRSTKIIASIIALVVHGFWIAPYLVQQGPVGVIVTLAMWVVLVMFSLASLSMFSGTSSSSTKGCCNYDLDFNPDD